MSTTKSTTSVIKQKNNVLTSQDICLIIRQCGESGVIELKFGDLHINMGRPTQSPQSDDGVRAITPEIEKIQKEISEKSLLEEELSTREEQLAQMLLENPAEAERLLLQGELTDESEPRSDDE